jgi:hypothetical protein
MATMNYLWIYMKNEILNKLISIPAYIAVHVFISLGLLINNCNVFSQIDTGRVHIITGGKNIASRTSEYEKIIGYDETGFYVLRKEFRFVLEHYDNDLNLTKKAYPKLFQGLTTFELEYAILFHGELYLFTSTQYFKKKVLYVETVNKITMEQNGDRRVFAEFPNFSGNWADFYFVLSKRQQKLMVCGQILAFWKKSVIQEIYVLDRELKTDWHTKKTLLFDNRIPSEMKFHLDDGGNVYLLGQTYQVGLFNFDLDQKNQFVIISYTNKGTSINKYYIKLTGKFIRELLMETGNDNNLFCAGLYSERARYGVSGVVCFTVDNSINQITGQNFVYLDPGESRNILMPAEESKRILVSHKANYLEVRKNGNFILGAEQQIDQSYDNFNEILLFCFRPNGTLAWRQTIYKKQTYNDPDEYNYCSYALFAPLDENRIEILYNDNAKNYIGEKNTRLKTFHTSTKSYLVQVEVNEYGQSGIHIIKSRHRRDPTPYVLGFYDTRKNAIIILNKKHIKYSFSILKFKL